MKDNEFEQHTATLLRTTIRTSIVGANRTDFVARRKYHTLKHSEFRSF